MDENLLSTLRSAIGLLALVLATAAVGRFAWIAANLEPPEAATVIDVYQPTAPPAPVADASVEIQGNEEPAPSLSDVKVMLSVRHEKGPAQVRINGQPMGQTDYVGEFVCKRGEPLTIRLIPKRGKPIDEHRVCEQGFIHVRR